MSALLGPRASTNANRGQLYSRGRPRARASARGGGTGRHASVSSDVSMADAPPPQQSSGRPRGENGARRQPNPRRARGELRAPARGGRHVSPSAPGGDGPQQRPKPPPSQSNIRNKSWINPVALNASIQSHAGRAPGSKIASWRKRPFDTGYRKQIDDLYQTLKEDRRRERIKAIKDGFLADPDKPTTLDCAITPVGTCEDMCPEFERVERIMQNTVEGMEKVLPPGHTKEKLPSEDIIVKKFRRSAAGYEEQLPSDIRPPLVLQRTLDYLINDVVGGPEPLAAVHGFVWDRTRSIRNDFSIQQVTKNEDVRIAIDCFERIVRFHILSLHQLSRSGDHDSEFSPQKERTQLNNALLSLHHYYEDNKNTYISPNEAEFRAYAIVFEIQDMRPDVEDRLQNLPKRILQDQRVQTALKLYAAAGNSTDQQGPLQPHTRFLTAQANTGGFWSTMQSNSVSYLMACVTEIYFNHVRRTCLKAIWKAYKGKRAGPTREGDNWGLNDLTSALGFDNEDQTSDFCENEGFSIAQGETGDPYIDLGSVDGANLTRQRSQPKQIFSKNLVETKRLGRTLPAVINGLTASQAHAQGLVEELTDAEQESNGNDDSLFVGGDSENEQIASGSDSETPFKRQITSNGFKPNPTAPAFTVSPQPAPGPIPGSSPFTSSNFGKPNGIPQIRTSQAESKPTLNFSSKTTQTTPTLFSFKEPSTFDSAAKTKTTQAQEASNLSNNLPKKELPQFNFGTHSTETNKTNNSLGSSPFAQGSGSTPSVFGQSSTNKPVPFPKQEDNASTQPAASKALTAAAPAKSIFDTPPTASTPPAFSFGTSALFQPVTKDQIPESTTNKPPSQQNDTTSKPSLFPTTASSSTPTNPFFATPKPTLGSASQPSTSIPFTPSVAPTTSPFASEGLSLSKPPPAASTIFPKSTSDGLFQTKIGPNPSQSQPSSNIEAPNTKDLFRQNFPSPSKPDHSNAASQSNSLFPDSITKETLSRSAQRDIVASPHLTSSSRSATVDELADAIMLGENGILQQYVEFTLGPIIESSIKQVEDEDSWELARECRMMLLRKKYGKRWRANAWSKSLMRKAKERRRTFAQSLQASARSTPDREGDLVNSFRTSVIGPMDPPVRPDNSASTMAPYSNTRQKRQSFPTALNYDQIVSEAAKGTKRKRDTSVTSDHHQTPKTTKLGHRRSQTIGDSIMSAPPRGLSHKSYKSRMDVSAVPKGSMLNDILMKQARRLAPTAKSDTTHTDYFRLKALGIDPDTPTVPQTLKRARDETTDQEEREPIQPVTLSKEPRQNADTQLLSPNPNTPSTKPTLTKDDDDEALFAQIRSVREALAESEQWMQSERQSIERTTTSTQNSMSPPNPNPNPETPAQRRLREIKERGHQPSRSEMRLRALGDKALLPKGFWDGEGMGRNLNRGKGGERASGSRSEDGWRGVNGVVQQPTNGLMGFAALGQRGFHAEDSEEVSRGASADDAIEL